MTKTKHFSKWHRTKWMRIWLEILAIIAPLLFLILALTTVIFIFRDRNQPEQTEPEWKDSIIADRVFSGNDLASDVFYTILTTKLTWANLSLYYPSNWIHFFEKRYGGKTLTIRPNGAPSYGMHIQLKILDNDTQLLAYNSQFLEHLNFNTDNLRELKFRDAQAYQLDTRYMACTNIPMITRFIFIKKNKMFLRIIIFAKEQTFAHKYTLFQAILDSISFSTTQPLKKKEHDNEIQSTTVAQ
jgi:hypothetical protein